MSDRRWWRHLDEGGSIGAGAEGRSWDLKGREMTDEFGKGVVCICRGQKTCPLMNFFSWSDWSTDDGEKRVSGVDRDFIGTAWPRVFMEPLYLRLRAKLLPRCKANKRSLRLVSYSLWLHGLSTHSAIGSWFRFLGLEVPTPVKTNKKTFNLLAMKYTAKLNKWDLLEPPHFLQTFSQQKRDCLRRTPETTGVLAEHFNPRDRFFIYKSLSDHIPFDD